MIVDLDRTASYGAWTGAEIEAFLSAARMPLRLALMTDSGMLIVPVWFEYRAGRLVSCSPQDSVLVGALRKRPEVGFDASTNEIPYRGVRGRGRARCSAASDKTALTRLLNRYIADTESGLSQWLLDRADNETVIEIEIEWLTSWDFSDRMKGIEKVGTRIPGAAL